MNKIKTIIKDYYDLDIVYVSPQQGGWSALAYKVLQDKRTYFLKKYEKSRASTPKWTALIDNYVPIIIYLMQNRSLKGEIPVPVLTKNGDYKCEDDEGIYLLYEYIEGETIGDKDLTQEQVFQLSEIITQLHLHGGEIPIETDAIKEDFHIPFLNHLRGTLDKENKCIPNDVREIINPHIPQIIALVEAVEKLSIYLKSSAVRMALCHTDLHNWNLMQSEQQLILIDWEGLKLAPVEADMMFFVDKPYFEQFLGSYHKIHKNYVINSDALKFYQSRRKLEDILEFIEQLLYDKQDSQERAVTKKYLTEELKDIGK